MCSGLLTRRTRRQPAIVILDHLSVAIRSVAVTEHAWTIVAQLRLKSSREFDFQLTQRVDHFTLQQRELRGIGKRVRIEAAQLLDSAIEIFCEIAVASQRAS